MENRHVMENKAANNSNKPVELRIPFLSGRPERTTIISEDEILNLRINLNITKSVTEFLELN